MGSKVGLALSGCAKIISRSVYYSEEAGGCGSQLFWNTSGKVSVSCIVGSPQFHA